MIRKLAIAALGSALLATAPVHAAQLILNNTDAQASASTTRRRRHRSAAMSAPRSASSA